MRSRFKSDILYIIAIAYKYSKDNAQFYDTQIKRKFLHLESKSLSS